MVTALMGVGSMYLYRDDHIASSAQQTVRTIISIPLGESGAVPLLRLQGENAVNKHLLCVGQAQALWLCWLVKHLYIAEKIFQ